MARGPQVPHPWSTGKAGVNASHKLCLPDSCRQFLAKNFVFKKLVEILLSLPNHTSAPPLPRSSYPPCTPPSPANHILPVKSSLILHFSETKKSIIYNSHVWPTTRGSFSPVKGFVRPSLGFSCSETEYWQPVLILIILNLTFLMQVALSATLSCLLPLQLGFERFQCIRLN